MQTQSYIPAPAPTWKQVVGTLGGILLGAVGLVVIGTQF